jgi:hypothetical protein
MKQTKETEAVYNIGIYAITWLTFFVINWGYHNIPFNKIATRSGLQFVFMLPFLKSIVWISLSLILVAIWQIINNNLKKVISLAGYCISFTISAYCIKFYPSYNFHYSEIIISAMIIFISALTVPLIVVVLKGLKEKYMP